MKVKLPLITLIILLFGITGFASPNSEAVHKLLDQFDLSANSKIAVLPVTDLSKKSRVNKKAMYSEIVQILQSRKKFSITDRTLINEILKEKELAMAGIAAGDDTKIGNLAGADYILSTVIEQGIVELKIVRTSDGMVGAYSFYKISEPEGYSSAVKPENIRVDTGWIPGRAYQAYFDLKLKFGYFPVEVRGRTFNGSTQFRGIYMINTKGVPWYTHHGITLEYFSKQSKKYQAEGFRLNYKSSFKDPNGVARINAVWVKP